MVDEMESIFYFSEEKLGECQVFLLYSEALRHIKSIANKRLYCYDLY